ncbi:MAG: 6-carboxytetrahydropterin synthase [Opitutaceae bacterium]|nr:6-carboxytetrahydropterin synthase [Opitutaceae bacterium]
MPFRICKSFEIESGHMLSKHLGKCRFPHGHSRRVDVILAAEALDANDMVCDFKAVKESLQGFLEAWDHALCLNTADPEFSFYQKTYGPRIIPFAGCDPTSEVMAQTIFAELQRRLRSRETPRIAAGVRLERVRITETSSSWAEYSEP